MMAYTKGSSINTSKFKNLFYLELCIDLVIFLSISFIITSWFDIKDVSSFYTASALLICALFVKIVVVSVYMFYAILNKNRDVEIMKKAQDLYKAYSRDIPHVYYSSYLTALGTTYFLYGGGILLVAVNRVLTYEDRAGIFVMFVYVFVKGLFYVKNAGGKIK